MKEHYFKAVSRRNSYYTLGMLKAKIVCLPKEQWVRSQVGPGFSCCKSVSKANKIIRYAKQRKILPIPKNMCVVKVEINKPTKHDKVNQSIYCQMLKIIGVAKLKN